MELKGVYTALITPFTNDGKDVDYDGLVELIKRQIASGVSGILPLGTTGEAPTLDSSEKKKIIKESVAAAAGKVSVMIGTGSNCSKTTIDNTKTAEDLGADMALVVSPYYNKPSQSGLIAHFTAVSKSVQLPIVVYNIVGRTGVNIEPETLKEIASLPNVIGVKESSGNLAQAGSIISEIQNLEKNFSVVSGDDPLTFSMMMLGAKGVVSVASNLIPEKIVELINLIDSGKIQEARSLHFSLLKLIETLFIETNPVPIKTALQLKGLPAGPVRLPLVALRPENRKFLCAVLKEYNLIEQVAC